MCLQFGFVIFWQEAFAVKDAHKMLVKLTPGWARTWGIKGMIGWGHLYQVNSRNKGL